MQDGPAISQPDRATPTHRVPHGDRRLVVAYGLLVVALAALAVLAARLPYFPGDVEAMRAVQALDWSPFGFLLLGISLLGFAPYSYVVYVSACGVFALCRPRLEVAVLLVGFASAPAHRLLKEMVGRVRPSPDLVNVYQVIPEPSFPSGHVVSFVTFYGFLLYLLWASDWRSPLRSGAMLVLGLLVGLVGLSRVYLGAHFPSDVVGGYLLGGLWLAAMVQLHRSRLDRDRPRR